MNRAWLIAKASLTQIDAYIETTEGMQEHLNISITAVPALLGEGTVNYFFPTEWISFFDIELPTVKPALLSAVILNLVEESLPEPIEAVHWVTPNRTVAAEGKTTVGIISRFHVENIINVCKEAGLMLEAAYPDVYLLPELEEGWTRWSDGIRLLVRQDHYRGFMLWAVESQDWEGLLPMPEKTVLYGVGEDARLFDMKTWVHALSQNPPPINVLQGDYADRSTRNNPQLLKKSLYALAGAVACYFMFLIIENVVLASRLHALQAETLALYQKVIPGATQATSPRVVIAREEQRVGGADHAFFTLLTSLSQALSRSPGILLTHLQYEGDQLSATVEAKDFETLDAWTASFQGASLLFKQEGAEQEDGHVTARIRLGS